MVERAARRRHDDVDTAAERSDLLVHRRAAVKRDDVEARPAGVLVRGFGHLHRQFARRHEHQCARGACLGGAGPCQPIEDRQDEGGGLAGAGAGLADQVATFEQKGDGLALDAAWALRSQAP